MIISEKLSNDNLSLKTHQMAKRGTSLASRTVKRINEVKYVEALLWVIAAFLGTAITICHLVPLLTDSWIYIIEPRPANIINEFGERMDVAFEYSTGYFRICRRHRWNVSSFEYIENLEMYIPDAELQLQCQWNSFFTGLDLSEFSAAAAGIQGLVNNRVKQKIPERLGISALVYFSGSLICFIAFYFGTIGFAERDCRTLLASMIYTCGGFFILVSVLQFICVVDDEMGHRMKPSTFGESSKYSYRYGYSFYFSSLSFLPLQICICFHAFLYFRRFPNAADKIKIVPGLRKRLNQVENEFIETGDGANCSQTVQSNCDHTQNDSLCSHNDKKLQLTPFQTYMFADAV
uniref:Uncharacterized protein n=1 Tax=Syphacia muris TaxID=451379 RepID=A0A158R5H0_9BILA